MARGGAECYFLSRDGGTSDGWWREDFESRYWDILVFQELIEVLIHLDSEIVDQSVLGVVRVSIVPHFLDVHHELCEGLVHPILHIILDAS